MNNFKSLDLRKSVAKHPLHTALPAVEHTQDVFTRFHPE